MTRTRFEAAIDKKRAQKTAEASGDVADSHSVRLAIMARVHSGEITLAQAQAELKQIQSKAKSIGLKTRAQAYNEG
jgi:ribosomal protein L11